MSKCSNQLLNFWWHHSLCLYRRPLSVTHEFWGILWFIIHIKHQNKQNKSCYRREKGRKIEYLNKFLLNDPLQILISLRGVKFQASSHRKGCSTSYREGGTDARRHHQPKVGEGSVSQKSRRALLGARWAPEDGEWRSPSKAPGHVLLALLGASWSMPQDWCTSPLGIMPRPLMKI